MDAARLQVDVEGSGDAVVFRLDGELDAHTSPVLAEALDGQDMTDRDVRVDFSGVSFVDSVGLRTIVNAHNEITQAGRKLTIVGLSDRVEKVFSYAGLLDHLDVEGAS